LKNHSEYIKTTKEWFRWTTGEEASSNTSFAFQLMPGIRYSINDINLKASMGFAKALKGGFNQISSSGNISIGYSILHKQNFVLYPSIGYIFGIGEKYKDYGAVQFKIGIEGPFI
ncbi:MAG: hypothetical protein Q8914_10100, partial [Bacteroidota bacterium]|nr:hypothetical protein [Bacteroidota bacterium]